MRRYSLAFTGMLLAILAFITWPAFTGHCADSSNSYPVAAQVYFSPNGGCTDAIVRTLAGAKKTVLVQAYSFTSVPIAKALIDAKKRGVAIQVILDKSQRTEKYSSATFLFNAGIPTYIDPAHAIAHNKIMVIDGSKVITGSFNFTKQAETSNAENLLILTSSDLAARYTANWKEHLSHSVPYAGHTSVVPSPHARQQHNTATTSSAATAVVYIGNVNSHIFHLPACSSLPTKKNQIIFHSRQEAIAAGYRPCGRCKP